jgi:hypothetical protein
MHYVIHKSHQMQKHKFGVMSPDTLFMETASGPPELENSVSMFHAADAPECTM